MSVFVFFIIVLVPIAGLTLIEINNIFLLIIVQTAIFSLFIYPAFCGLFKKNILAFFVNRQYFNCAIHGLYIATNLTIYGTALMLLFIIIYKATPSNLKILTALFGGTVASLWLLLLTNFTFFPILSSSNLSKCVKLSKQTAKNFRLELFAILLKTYIEFLTIIFIPHAIKAYVKQTKLLWSKRPKLKIYTPSRFAAPDCKLAAPPNAFKQLKRKKNCEKL